jgi:hypothetical protein
MPTSRPRHTITETEEMARALDDAARRWPMEASKRGALLVHLAREGHRSIRRTDSAARDQQQDAVRRTAGRLSGVYPRDYLKRLRDDWPS